MLRPVSRLLAVVAVSLAFATACGYNDDARSSEEVRAVSQNARHAVAGGALLLDVRTPSEFARGHIEGATNIPLGQLPSRMGEVPANRPVVVYCRSGHRSAIAARMLKQKGRGSVTDLGAMSNW